MNILIKLMSIVSLVIAPTLAGLHAGKIQENRKQKLGTMMASCVAAGCTTEECNTLMTNAQNGVVASNTKSCCKDGEKNDKACCAGESEECKKECGGKCDKATCTKPCCAKNATASTTVNLPGNIEMSVSKGGIEEQMIQFMSAPDFAGKTEEQLKDKWFDFNAVNFEMGSAKLTAESKTQLDNLAAILKAYPTMKIKIGGYTDKTGDAAANKKLSQERADAIKAYLNSPQVTGAEGYGDKFATVAATASDAERAVDRKMSLRFTK